MKNLYQICYFRKREVYQQYPETILISVKINFLNIQKFKENNWMRLLKMKSIKYFQKDSKIKKIQKKAQFQYNQQIKINLNN